MLQKIKVSSPCTVYVHFTSTLPNLFTAHGKDEIYFWRYLNGKTPRIKFNIPDPGEYTFNVPVSIVKITGIEIPDMFPELPPAERDRMYHNPTVIIDENLDDMARNFTQDNTIVFGKRWLELPMPCRLFIELHEKWHGVYRTESYCDMGALIDFLRMGYNRSTGFYCLDHFLTDNSENRFRVKQLFNNIQKTQKESLL